MLRPLHNKLDIISAALKDIQDDLSVLMDKQREVSTQKEAWVAWTHMRMCGCAHCIEDRRRKAQDGAPE